MVGGDILLYVSVLKGRVNRVGWPHSGMPVSLSLSLQNRRRSALHRSWSLQATTHNAEIRFAYRSFLDPPMNRVKRISTPHVLLLNLPTPWHRYNTVTQKKTSKDPFF